MLAADPNRETRRNEDRISYSEKEVVELALLLPQQQLEALEIAAGARGMTTGQLIRRLIADFLDEPFRS